MAVKNKNLSLLSKVMLRFYGLNFMAALLFLRRNRRLQNGWSQRVLKELPGSCDLWIQAASGGEAYLAAEILQKLDSKNLKVLVTTNTVQGLEILQTAAKMTGVQNKMQIQTCFCPFDRPGYMRRYVQRISPQLIVLLETELWPGMLAAAQKQGVNVLLANGRISPKSLKGYSRVKGLFRALAPQAIMAISAEDAMRFQALFPDSVVSVMPNIKFDRIQAAVNAVSESALAGFLPEDAPFVMLGSTRKEEEPQVLEILKGVLAAHPQAVIGLYPRHMERVPFWREMLSQAGYVYNLRSQLTDTLVPGSVLLGDTFGELSQAYQYADAVFVGGSLMPLGGQNFLEVLAAGVVPVIGSSWKNFTWVGTDLVAAGLLVVAPDVAAVVAALNNMLEQKHSKAEIKERFAAYVAPNLGGTRMVCDKIKILFSNK